MGNQNKLKVQLKLAIQRSKLLQTKKVSLQQHQRKELADLLKLGKIESARIRVEHIIREDYNMEAMEVLEMLCDLLLARSGLLESTHCDPAIQEAVHTIIYAAARSEIKELIQVRDQLISKFGRPFGEAAITNRLGLVNPRVIQRLHVQAPDPALVTAYLSEIAKTYNVPFEDKERNETGFSAAHEQGASSISTYSKEAQQAITSEQSHVISTRILPPYQSSASIPPLPGDTNLTTHSDVMDSTGALDLPELPSHKPKIEGSGGDDISDFDELAKRFEELKRR